MFDVKIVNGLLVRGDGAEGRPGEIGIRQGRIAAISASVAGAAQRTIDAGGHMVTPGFIDLHTHCVPGVNENYLQSGVTTVVGGNCGFSPLDIQKVAADCAGKCGLNLAMLVGHNDVRTKVMGNVNRAPTASELQQMCGLIDRAMQDGAAGFSTGLTYVPGNYSQTAEVAELAGAAARHGGYYTSHMRDEGEGLLDSIRETVAIGRASGLPVHLSHLKVRGCNIWGRSRGVVELLDQYRAQGLDVTQDQYPYTASCGRIYLLYPAWAQEGGPADRLARLADAKQRAQLKKYLIAYLTDIHAGDGERVVISDAPDAALAGRSLADIAQAAGRKNQPDDLAETVMDIAARFPELTQVYCVFHGMCEEDVKTIMRHPTTAVGSDAWAPRASEARPHPRMFGTFPRVLGHYAREQQVFPMAEAVRRMTGLPARRLGLKDRGLLQEGAWADITVFDPATVIDRATFDHPKQYPAGFDCVLVNGQVVVDHGTYTGALPGGFMTRP